jgi:hypothetical protein
MQYKDIIIGAEDLECHTIDTVAEAIVDHIIDLGIATPETIAGFTWRLDVRLGINNDTV